MGKGDYSKYFKLEEFGNVFKLDFQLEELDGMNNIVNGSFSQSLITHHVIADFDVTKIQPRQLQYKKLRKGIFDSLNIKIRDENGILIKNRLSVYITLNIR